MPLHIPFRPARRSRDSFVARPGLWVIQTATGASQKHGTAAPDAGPLALLKIYGRAIALGTSGKPVSPQSKTEHTPRFFAPALEHWKAGHMRNLIGRIASRCALTLTSWSASARGLTTEISPLSDFARSVSDKSLAVIDRHPAGAQRTQMAEGMIDGASRYLDGERPEAAPVAGQSMTLQEKRA